MEGPRARAPALRSQRHARLCLDRQNKSVKPGELWQLPQSGDQIYYDDYLSNRKLRKLHLWPVVIQSA